MIRRTLTNRRSRIALVLVFGSLAAGCALEANGARGHEEVTASASAPLLGPEVLWTQYDGVPQKVIGNVRDSFCFLTRISGRFYGLGEGVFLELQNDRWVLGGKSDQIDVTVGARCVPWSDFGASGSQSMSRGAWSISTQYSPDGPNVAIREDLWGLPSSFCMLSGVNGRFDGTGEGVSVQNLHFGANDRFQAWSHVDNGQPLIGNAMCGTFGQPGLIVGAGPGAGPGTLGEYIWDQTSPETRLARVSDGVCFLTTMSGEFRGSGESIYVTQDVDGYWYLGGTSYQQGVAAEATCLSYQQFPPPPPPAQDAGAGGSTGSGYSGGGGGGGGTVLAPCKYGCRHALE